MSTTYHKKEITIAGETITAEYFESDFKFPDKKQSKFSDIWYTITLPFYRVKRKVRDIYWEIRYAFQRAFKEYDYVDTFETYAKFIDRYYKILTDYRNNMHSHPGTMNEHQWYAIVEKMIFHLWYMDENHVDAELCKDVPKNWLPTLKTSYEIMEHHKNEFFKLFSEHFYDLWD